MKRKPNFFLVGAAKSGTTAMAVYLNRHPDIFMGQKEAHFFASDLMPAGHYALDPEVYANRFREAENQKIVGDASVFYLYSRVAAARIRDYSSDARILIHLRHPVELLYSHHSQLVYEGGEPIKDFEKALRAEADRKARNKFPTNFIFYKTMMYSDFVRFSEQVERYFDVFGRERVLVNKFDDFKSDTLATYRKTLEFLDVDPDFTPETRVVNPNKRIRSEWAMRNLVRDPPVWLSKPARLFMNAATRKRLKQKLKRANTRFVKRPPMRPELYNRLLERSLPEIEHLEELLGWDLSGWKIPRDTGS